LFTDGSPFGNHANCILSSLLNASGITSFGPYLEADFDDAGEHGDLGEVDGTEDLDAL
jgi:hypothetical protein